MLAELFRAQRSSVIDYEGRRVYLRFTLSVPTTCDVTVVFEQTNSEWRQGVWIGAVSKEQRQQITVAGQTAPSVRLWQDTAPKEVSLHVEAPTGQLDLYNVWDNLGNGTGWSQMMGAGMLVEDLEPGRTWRFRCNDGHPTATFDSIVFRVTIERP